MLNKHRDQTFIDNLIRKSDATDTVVMRRMRTTIESQPAAQKISIKPKEKIKSDYEEQPPQLPKDVSIEDSWAEEAAQY